MLKRMILSIVFIGGVSVRAGDNPIASFFGAFFGALLGRDTSPNSSQSSISALPPATSCACGERSRAKLRYLNCCGAVLCESCLTARRHTASINSTSPKCHKCSRSFDYDMADQAAIANSLDRNTNDRVVTQPRPSAPLLNNNVNDRVLLCASGCGDNKTRAIGCGGNHRMCDSCLRSRIDKARKEAHGGEPYVTCPKCNDMLTARVIGSI